jgi:signal transduction histidine kinase
MRSQDIGNTEQTVLGNEVALKQIFRNLISNGIKFGTAERKPEIQIWAERDREDIKVFVQDNGIGIAPQHIEQIFKPFHRLHTPEEFPGVGMGLAIARLSAERMGAKLGVESFPGKGSCFYLDIKRAPAQEHPTFVADLLHA